MRSIRAAPRGLPRAELRASRYGASAARRAAQPQHPPLCRSHAALAALAEPSAPPPALWGPRPVGSHPAAYDPDPPFSALPALNDPLLCARLLGSGAADTGSQRTRLGTDADAEAAAFAGEHVYARLCRAVARERCVDAKELVEALELYHRIRRRVRRRTVVDLACGHGLLGLLFGALERDVERVLLLDARQTASHAPLLRAVATVAPWLPAKVTFLQADLRRLPGGADAELAAGGAAVAAPRHAGMRRVTGAPVLLSERDETEAAAAELRHTPPGSAGFVALHACGALTDVCFGIAAAARGPVAALPCCYTGTSAGAPTALRRALGVSLAADVARVYRLEDAGFTADFVAVPSRATPMNRGIVAVPRREGAAAAQDGTQ